MATRKWAEATCKEKGWKWAILGGKPRYPQLVLYDPEMGTYHQLSAQVSVQDYGASLTCKTETQALITAVERALETGD